MEGLMVQVTDSRKTEQKLMCFTVIDAKLLWDVAYFVLIKGALRTVYLV